MKEHTHHKSYIYVGIERIDASHNEMIINFVWLILATIFKVKLPCRTGSRYPLG
jgi:hypothetical protein